MIIEDEGIDFSDIPEITDFSNAVMNPHAGKLKNGYTIIIEHKDYDEVITISKTKRPKGTSIKVADVKSEASADSVAESYTEYQKVSD